MNAANVTSTALTASLTYDHFSGGLRILKRAGFRGPKPEAGKYTQSKRVRLDGVPALP